MELREREEIYLDALAKWGSEPQLRQAQEECAELIVAVNHLMRGRDGAEGRLVEELADSLIILNQLVCYFGHERVDRLIDQKLSRLKERLDALPK